MEIRRENLFFFIFTRNQYAPDNMERDHTKSIKPQTHTVLFIISATVYPGKQCKRRADNVRSINSVYGDDFSCFCCLRPACKFDKLIGSEEWDNTEEY